MKRFTTLLFATAIALAGTAGSAHAATITNIFDPTDVLFPADPGTVSAPACTGTNPDNTATGDTTDATSTGCSQLDFDHDISGQYPIPPGLLSGSLTLWFYNATDPGQGNPQEVVINIDFGAQTQTFSIANSADINNQVNTGGYDVLGQLTNDGGVLHVTLTVGQQGSGQADFYFAKSILTATYPDNETAPEPASLLLFGSGLAGLGYKFRRKSSRG
jgi:hypothetical protein